MTTKADFTDEEWTRLARAPLVAGMAISFADPGGPIEMLKESTAAIQAVLDAAQTGAHGPFVQSLAQEVADRAQRRENPMAGFKPKRSQAPQEILEELRAVNALMNAKLTPAEAESMRAWLKTAAQRTATAAKEGGFLGFNAVLVSEREQQMLDQLAAIFEPA